MADDHHEGLQRQDLFSDKVMSIGKQNSQHKQTPSSSLSASKLMCTIHINESRVRKELWNVLCCQVGSRKRRDADQVVSPVRVGTNDTTLGM
jgi:hypothetical protein